MCVSSATTNTDQEASQTTSNDSSSNNNSNDTSVTDHHHHRHGEAVESSEKIQTTKSGLTKAKEKYMRLHDKMLEQERELARKREAEADSRLAAKLRRHDVWACGRRAAASIAARLWARVDAWKDHKIYKILFCTTQPAHVITIAAVLCVTSALLPNDRLGTTTTTTTGAVAIDGGSSSNPVAAPRSKLTAFVYLASFVMHFGSQVWMTFVSGLSLYFALPRHTFGEVQRVLFPRYFSLNACLSLVTLLIYVKHHPAASWDWEIGLQVGGMSGAFFCELLIRLYLTPPLLRLIDQKTSLERAAGVGAEIGRHDPGPLKHCPHYMKIHGEFRRVHMIIAMGNMLTMACTVLHLHYIAGNMCAL